MNTSVIKNGPERTRRMKYSFSPLEFPAQRLWEKNQPWLDKNLGRRNILREGTSVGQNKKVKKLKDKRLRKYGIFFVMNCILQRALWIDVKSWRMGVRGKKEDIQCYVRIRVVDNAWSSSLKCMFMSFVNFIESFSLMSH